MTADTLRRAAMIYDFDGTLSPGAMQQHTFLPQIGYEDTNAFWQEVKERKKVQDADETLIYLQMMLEKAPEKITRKTLEEHGARLPFFDGVEEWFHRMNDYARERELALEHYIVSSGNREMIEGCSIRSKFKGVFASGYAYDDKGHATWPAVAVNYTNKTQFIFRINKGISNTWNDEEINRWIPMDERPLPFERMIFIGDGDTDIPSMKMIRVQGGSAIAVFDPAEWSKEKTQQKVGRLIAEDRANYAVPADYCPGRLLDITVKGILGRIAREAGYRPVHRDEV